MTPFELDILLHYYCRMDEHIVVRANPPIWPETRDRFIAEGLLEVIPAEERTDRTYRLAERGTVFLDALTDVPLPVKKWVMER